MDLSEAVIVLQRQDLAPETRDVVEEAARLLGEGREGEARALLEKAEALAALANPAETAADDPDEPSLRDAVAPLAARLAEGLTGVLTSVLEEIHRYAGDQMHVVAQSLQQRIEELDSALCDVVVVAERLEQRAGDQLQSQDELWTAVRGLQESGQQHSEGLSRVSTAAEELSQRLASEVEAAASRFVSLEDRIGAIEVFAQEVPAQFSDLLARLDGHNEALRSLEHRQTQRVSRLNQVLDALAGLRDPEIPELAMQAVA